MSEEAICRGRRADFSANLPASDETAADIIDDAESEDFNNCGDELCPRCGAVGALIKNGCWVCRECGQRECG